MLNINNKYYTWGELVKLYPDSWVVVENTILDKGNFIKAGELIAVYNDNEIDDFVANCYNMGRRIRYKRTTTESVIGVM